MGMERGGLGTWRARKFAERRGTALQPAARRMLGGRRRGCGWLRACGRRGPARVGAAGVGGDGQRARPDRVQEEPAPAAAGRRHPEVTLWGAELGEAGLRVLLGDAADVQVSCGGRVRPVGARAGAAGARVQCLGLWFVRTVCCVCTAMLWSCLFVAWEVLGTGSVMGVRSMRSRLVRFGAGQRSARRNILRHWGPCCCKKVVFYCV
mmetsp:Transcript_12314/g.31985  ORF Transcript_12314/g.31985 Transcript_12314/m.31985 type:complete len:207 (-) Transcript_12314:6-626(-)